MRTDYEQWSERGASVVEYALFVALIALVVTGAVSRVGSSSHSSLSKAGVGISPVAAGAGSGSGGSSGGSGGGESPPPTTAAPPTTVATTVPPPTTAPPTTAPPTTTSEPASSSASFSDATAVEVNRNRWKATAVVDLRSDDGSALSDATVTVRVRTYVIDKKGNGEWEESTIEVSTDDEGRAEIDSGNLKRNGNNRVTEVELVIDDVQAADDSEWDGNDTSTSVTAP